MIPINISITPIRAITSGADYDSITISGTDIADWTRSSNEFLGNKYDTVEEQFTINLGATTYQGLQNRLRPFFRAQSSSSEGAHGKIGRYSHKLAVTTSGIGDTPLTFSAYCRNIRFELPNNDFRLLSLNGIIGATLTLDRLPYQRVSGDDPITATPSFPTSASLSPPLYTSFDTYAAGVDEFGATHYHPSPVNMRLTGMSDQTPSGFLLYSNGNLGMNIVNFGNSRTGWTRVTGITTAYNTDLLRTTNEVAPGATLGFTGVSESLSAQTRRRVALYGAVMASGVDFELTIGLGNAVGSDVTGTVWGNPVRVPNTYPYPQVSYLGTIAANSRLPNTIAMNARNIGTVSGRLYIDYIFSLPLDNVYSRVLKLFPQDNPGSNFLVDATNALITGVDWKQHDYSNDFTLSVFDSDLNSGDSVDNEYPFYSYAGSNDFWAEFSLFDIALLATRGIYWNYTTSSGTALTPTIAYEYQPLWPQMPRF